MKFEFFSSLIRRLPDWLDRRPWTFGLGEAVIVSIAGIAIAGAVAYCHVG